MELDRVPLWRGDHVAIKQLVEDFGRYLYLPRLAEPSVLIEATMPDGAPDHVVRILTENSRTLKYGRQGFEEE